MLDLRGIELILKLTNGDELMLSFDDFETKSIFCSPEHEDALTRTTTEIIVTHLPSKKNTIQKITVKGVVMDFDRNIYPVTTIGDQIWMTKNLNSMHYSDGTATPNIIQSNLWNELNDNNIDDAFCYYENDIDNSNLYGALYTWSAATGGKGVSSSSDPSDVQGACPIGWHLPSDSEWTILESFLAENGYSGVEADALKSIDGWANNGNRIDEFNFTALAGGGRTHTGDFYYIVFQAYWWSVPNRLNSWIGFM
jgi:uncharacterized protein (TIGR02145 family)